MRKKCKTLKKNSFRSHAVGYCANEIKRNTFFDIVFNEKEMKRHKNAVDMAEMQGNGLWWTREKEKEVK